MEQIKNVIFDLGGVIIDLDVNKTFQAFNKIIGKDFTQIFSKSQQSQFVTDYEIGKIDSSTFRNHIRELLQVDTSDQAIDDAWNAMLSDFPKRNIEFVRNVSLHKRTFILSNTNEIHKQAADKVLLEKHNGSTWEKLVEKAYFSHIMGDRKPNESIFRTVLNENQLIPEETLFIDDSPQHVEGASKTGIQTTHLKDGMSITELGII